MSPRESSPYSFGAYRRLVVAQSMAITGRWTGGVAASWLVARLAGNAAGVGTLVAVSVLPSAIAGPISGRIADRSHLRRVASAIWLLAVIPGASLAILSQIGRMSLPAIYLLAAVSTVPMAFASTFGSRLLSAAVPDEHATHATTDASIPASASRLLGALAGGYLAERIGIAATFWVTAALASGTGALYWSLPDAVWERARPRHDSAESDPVGISLRDALAIPIVRVTVFTGVMFLLLISPLQRLAAPVAAAHNENASSVGILTASTAIGAMAANLFLRKMIDRGIAAMKLMGAGIFLGGLAMLACALLNRFAFDLAAFALIGVAWEYSTTTGQASIQRHAPPGAGGRVNSVTIAAGAVAAAVGATALSQAMDGMGLRPAIALAGVVAIAFGLHHYFWTSRTLSQSI